MGIRQRNGFDGVTPAREDLNLTKYDEKYIYPTEPNNGDGYRAPQSPAPDPAEHSYVFGRHEPVDARASVFGGERQAPAPISPEYAPQPAVESERPMVFVLRDDPNMFVYEYSDRLEYFRRTEAGMVHCATKFKMKKY